MIRPGVGDNGVRQSHPFDIAAEDACAPGDRFIADQDSLSFHGAADLGGFAAGRGTKVQDLFSGFRVQHCCRNHRRGLLNIERAGGMKNRCARVRIRVKIP